MLEKYGINRTWLKIIALITMTIDHIGVVLFPNVIVLRIIGRIAMPLFAYMIAEGAYYTKNRLKYLLTILILGIVCLIAYVVFMHEWYYCILMAFSLSLGLIYSYDYILKGIKNIVSDEESIRKSIFKIIIGVLAFALLIYISIFLSFPPSYLAGRRYGLKIDYGLASILSPFIIYVGFKNKWVRYGLFILTVVLGTVYLIYIKRTSLPQWYSLLAIPFILLYNGRKGKYSLKYFFYIYYPLHLLVIEGIYMLINR